MMADKTSPNSAAKMLIRARAQRGISNRNSRTNCRLRFAARLTCKVEFGTPALVI
ncbi:MAG TPA: hypothetical protein VK767_15810 [Bradyrhizobium sp.]|nr:hypothetical protein [Bradyrhizobium sp.]